MKPRTCEGRSIRPSRPLLNPKSCCPSWEPYFRALVSNPRCHARKTLLRDSINKLEKVDTIGKLSEHCPLSSRLGLEAGQWIVTYEVGRKSVSSLHSSLDQFINESPAQISSERPSFLIAWPPAINALFRGEMDRPMTRFPHLPCLITGITGRPHLLCPW